MASSNEPGLKKKYKEAVAAELQKEFDYSSSMSIPRVEKVSVSVGVGEAVNNKKLLDSAVKELERITGQRAIRTKARKSIRISNFGKDRRSARRLRCAGRTCGSFWSGLSTWLFPE